VARQLDVSMHATTVWTTMAAWPSVLLGGRPLQRTGNLDRYERWQGIVECRDGAIAVTVHDDADERAARKVTSDLGTEPSDIASTLERWAANQSAAAAVATLRAAGVAAGPLRGVIDLMADTGLRSRAVLTTSRHCADGDVAVMAAPITFSDVATRTPLPAPVLGGDTTAVLRERAGYSDVEVAELLSSNTILQANGPGS
jgi:crotonobetainyl-CoA:carnitine CoA-transferase CaiB-like acyl-CoA transferase